jgi:dethiobiotin synthetase
MEKSYFITAIDTDAGKSVVTGLIARYLHEKGVRVITQKMAQTGCTGASEDIETHHRITGIAPLPEDLSGETCPYIFPFPASPQLSAQLVGERIDLDRIHLATKKLEAQYDCVLTEGVGGIRVPLVDDRTVLEYMEEFPQPVILVTNGKLGSVNHTLLTLEVLKVHGIAVVAMVYNGFIETDPVITADSRTTLERYLRRLYPSAVALSVPAYRPGDPTPDFSAVFEV